MKDILISSSGDASFFPFLELFAYNSFAVYGTKPLLFDLGLSDAEHLRLTTIAQVVKLDAHGAIADKARNGAVKTLHKLDCIEWLIHNRQKPFLFIDADCLFFERLRFPCDCDMAVTFRHPDEQTLGLLSRFGIINAGVLFFNPQKRQQLLSMLVYWRDYACRNDLSDQHALSNILLTHWIEPRQQIVEACGLRFRLLRAETHNDVKFQTGGVYHFRNLSRDLGVHNLYLRTYARAVKNRWWLVRKTRLFLRELKRRSYVKPDPYVAHFETLKREVAPPPPALHS